MTKSANKSSSPKSSPSRPTQAGSDSANHAGAQTREDPNNRESELPGEREADKPGAASVKGSAGRSDPNVALPKGKMIILVFGTALDYDLDALTFKNGTFRLSGHGINFVGRASQSWRKGQSVAIEPRVNGVGESELDLPQTGKIKVISGQIKLDDATNEPNMRIKAHITFTLQAPDGPSSFEGTFEVGVLTQ
jgi:hypothetical protein